MKALTTMNRIIKNISRFLLLAVTLLSFVSCEEEASQPNVESVWLNMVRQPIEQIDHAYPKQTICLHGSGFSDLTHIIVNGTEISLNTLYVYESDKYITFQLPSNVNTDGDNIRVVTKWGMTDYNFIVRPSSEQPSISSFSSTTLVPNNVLTIKGSNLGGAKEVWLPLTFDGTVKCEIDDTQTNDDSAVHVIIPEGVNFATGQCMIVMEKADEKRGITYTETVYSDETDFIN
jgi:hypothetical protein